MLERSVASSWLNISRKLNMPVTGGSGVITEESRWLSKHFLKNLTSSIRGLVAYPAPSLVNALEASHMLPAPRLQGVMQDRSSYLAVGGMRVTVAKSGCGTGGTTTVRG